MYLPCKTAKRSVSSAAFQNTVLLLCSLDSTALCVCLPFKVNNGKAEGIKNDLSDNYSPLSAAAPVKLPCHVNKNKLQTSCYHFFTKALSYQWVDL